MAATNLVADKNVFDVWDLVHSEKADPENDPMDTKRISLWSHPEGAYIHAMHSALWGDMHWIVKGKNADGAAIMAGTLIWMTDRVGIAFAGYPFFHLSCQMVSLSFLF